MSIPAFLLEKLLALLLNKHLTYKNFRMKLGRIILVIVSFLALLFAFQRDATDRSINGLSAYLPYLTLFAVIIVAVLNYKKIGKWMGLSFAALFLLSSCNYIPADKIGVRVENFGKAPSDFKIVYGKFPRDWSASSWNLDYPGQSFGVPINGFNVFCKDGVSLWCDPSILCELIRTDEACQKYAFKFFSYQSAESFQKAIEQVVLKETLDAVRNVIGEAISDSIIFNRGAFEARMQAQLSKVMVEKYGLSLSQFSVILAPPEALQKAINDRLLAQEETKKTMASLDNAKAKLQLAEIDQRRMNIESEGLTPEILKKLEMEYNYNGWVRLAQSQNKVFISGSPSRFMISGN